MLSIFRTLVLFALIAWVATIGQSALAQTNNLGTDIPTAGSALTTPSESTQPTTAALPFDLRVSPSVVELAMKPGKIVTQAFLLTNHGTIDQQVTVELRDFKSQGIDGLPDIQPDTNFTYATLINSEIDFNQPFLLPAGESQQLILSIDLPEETVEKDWYLSLLMLTEPDLSQTVAGGTNGQKEIVSQGKENNQSETNNQDELLNQDSKFAEFDQFSFSPPETRSQTLTKGAVAAHILLRVTSDNQPQQAWKIQLKLPKVIDSLQKISLSPVVTNLGNSYGTPQFSLLVTDWRKQVILDQTGLPERILAGGQRRVLAQQPQKEDPRSLTGVPFVFAPKFALGSYTFRASIADPNGGNPEVVEETVIALPFSLIGLVFGIWLIRWIIKKITSGRDRQLQTTDLSEVES